MHFPKTQHGAKTVIYNCCKDMVCMSDGNINLLTTTNNTHLLTVRGPHVSASLTTTKPATTRPKQTALAMAFEKGSPYDRTWRRWKEVTGRRDVYDSDKNCKDFKILLKIGDLF